jgi:hypothetical protein
MHGECNPRRFEMSAQVYAEKFGDKALARFLQSTAGASRIEDVPEEERFRVNREMRNATNGRPKTEGTSLPDVLARIGRNAFAKMVRK